MQHWLFKRDKMHHSTYGQWYVYDITWSVLFSIVLVCFSLVGDSLTAVLVYNQCLSAPPPPLLPVSTVNSVWRALGWIGGYPALEALYCQWGSWSQWSVDFPYLPYSMMQLLTRHVLLWKLTPSYPLLIQCNCNRPLQKRERTGKEYACFPFVWKTKIFKWKINYILESLPRLKVYGGGNWQNGSSSNITQNREFVWIG